ncbi:sulfatase [Kineococcus sp. LSe6-4]|uniref:Sulfatase n=1 Tax=Kineococcus halophytocola TaxID=3234027 RepID=A0ABV4GYK2_9ACTN
MTGAARTRPNVLWISTHDISPHLGCYAGVWPDAESATTPHLDRLAAEGVRWDRAFASVPVCGPSRSAITTGCFPTAIGTMHMRTKAVPPPQVRLLPELFREAGYWTTSTGFTDFQVNTPPTTFDVFGDDAHWRSRPDGRPFFAAFHGLTTHESSLYLDDEAFAARTPHVRPDQRRDPAAVVLPPYYPDTPVFRRTWARYHELITEMDHEIGVLLGQLEEDGLAEDTVVVFWSDHGVGMPRAKRYPYEAGLREPLLVRWPGVLPAGSVRTELVHLLDLYPTVLQAAGLPVPDHVHGRALFGPEGTFDDAPRPYVFGSRDRMDEQEDTSRTVRDERFRYIRNYHPDRSWMQHQNYADHTPTWAELRRLVADEGRQLAQGLVPDVLTDAQRSFTAPSKPAEELYDVEADPHETRNLAADPAHADDLARLSAALEEWQTTFGDLGLRPERELAEHWRPGGRWERTATPAVERADDGSLTLTCATPGAVVGWSPAGDPASPAAAAAGGGLLADPGRATQILGNPEPDGRTWQLATGPAWPPAGDLMVRAWRLGFLPSEEVVVPAHATSTSTSTS